MLGAPLEEWRMFLHPAQRKAVEQVYRGPARVLGDAGTGKAVVAMHRARHLARGLSGEDRVLLTTLADDSQIPRCRHIVVDEAQDFAPVTLRLVRELAGPERRDDLFIVGDARQRIFSKRATLHRCGIEIRGRGSRLIVNFRKTEEMFDRALSVLGGVENDDLDGGYVFEREKTRSLRHGNPPVISSFVNETTERAGVCGLVCELEGRGVRPEDICIAFRTKAPIGSYQKELEGIGIETLDLSVVKKSSGNVPSGKLKGVWLATMHRVKGLEFDYVIIAQATSDNAPLAQKMRSARAPVDARHTEAEERSLLYVAMTRSRRATYITFSGPPSPFLTDMRQYEPEGI